MLKENLKVLNLKRCTNSILHLKAGIKRVILRQRLTKMKLFRPYWNTIVRSYRWRLFLGLCLYVLVYVALNLAGNTFSTTHFRRSAKTLPPSIPTRLSDDDIQRRFADRLRALQGGCYFFGNKTELSEKAKFLPFPRYPPVINSKVRYCPIEKIASTTWKGVFKAIKAKMRDDNIQAVEDTTSTPNDSSASHDSITFTFVREPYSRLLSGYVDKLFSPNAAFWVLGRSIVRRIRPNASNHSLRCGHDATFSEVVKFILHTYETRSYKDPHFVPTHEHCGFCREPYQYIGHFETLQEDMPYLLKLINSPVNISKPYENETMEVQIKLSLGQLRDDVSEGVRGLKVDGKRTHRVTCAVCHRV